MDITKATILKKNIDNELWLEIIFVITYIKNNCPIKAFHQTPLRINPKTKKKQMSLISIY